MVKNYPAIQETQVRSLGWEDPLEEGMATHSSILAWRIPWTEEPGGLQYIGVCKESDMTERLSMHIYVYIYTRIYMCVCVCVCVCIHVLGRIFHMKQNSAWQLVSAQQYDLFLLNIIIVFLIKKFLF